MIFPVRYQGKYFWWDDETELPVSRPCVTFAGFWLAWVENEDRELVRKWHSELNNKPYNAGKKYGVWPSYEDFIENFMNQDVPK